MSTLQSGNSPGQRVAVGESVIAAAQALNVKPIGKRFAAFVKVQAAYAKADALVKKANEALQKQQAKVGEADVTQDEAVLALAVALPADGLPRVNPFKPLGAPAPAKLCVLGYGDEAKQVLALEKAVLKYKGISKASAAAARTAGKAALAVQGALADLPKLEKARATAIIQRDALAQGWETAFAGLKRAARAAADEGAPGLYEALFERKDPPAKKAKGKKAAPPKGEAPAGEGKPV
jgi:hypothetical protein